MSTSYHVRTTRFSLVGRHIILHEALNGFTEGIIVKQIGPARFKCHLNKSTGEGWWNPVEMDLNRSEFKLPRLRQSMPTEWLTDDYDGFVYADISNFNSWRN